MYDPLVVDTFAAVRDKLADQHRNLETSDQPILKRAPEGASTQEQKVALAPRIADEDFLAASHTVVTSVRDATSATLAVLFLRDSNVDEAFPVASSATDRKVVLNRMPLGSGVTGWVIANGRTMVNADASLDFATRAAASTLNRCTSVPINLKGEAVGAIACYSADPRGFNDRDVAVIEKIASTFNEQPLLDLMKRVSAGFGRPAAVRRSVH